MDIAIKTKGKCFSACNRGQRLKSDRYQTHYSLTEQLLEKEKFDYDKTVLEPCCGGNKGNGAIVRILKKYFRNEIWAFDIIDGEQMNFIKFHEGNENKSQYDYIITNPPFSLAFEFIQKSKEIAKEKFAMLLPLSYLHGQKRYEEKLFTDPEYPLTKIYVFTRYPLLEATIREDGKYRSGMIVYSWFIFEKDAYLKYAHDNFPVIKWIDNNQYVLRKNK